MRKLGIQGPTSLKQTLKGKKKQSVHDNNDD